MTRRGFFLMFAVMLTLSMGVITTPAMAQDDDIPAPCCIVFNNSMSCTITFCVKTPSGPTCVTVPGNTTVTLTLHNIDCASPTVYVTDICGTARVIPPQGCAVVALAGCCPRICLTRDLTRCWQVTTSPSPFCYACPHQDIE